MRGLLRAIACTGTTQMSLNLVYEPITINGVEIPNRIARSAHGTSLALGGAIDENLISYHLARARGGVGLTILEAAAVHPSTITSFANCDDSIIDGYRRLMAQIRPHGMRVFQQLWHGGHIYPTFDGSPPWGVSSVPNPATGIVPHVMSIDEIEELIAAYADAAWRCREGGLDGLEVHAAHGYLVMQFLNPATNLRSDRYGGSAENRMRFLREIIQAIRARIGGDYPLGIRVGRSEAAGRLEEAQINAVIDSLRADRLIDFINVSYGDYWGFGFTRAMDMPVGYQLETAARITRAHDDLPRMVIGRFRTLEEAEQVIRSGDADIVHMTRAHIADPDIVRKTRAGKAEQVRPCIGCNQGCWYAVTTGWPIGCTVNPAAGKEARFTEDLIELSSAPLRVLVVGGGPAGMEAARVAALRGHRVKLVEASPRLGGQVALARRAPRLHSIGDITAWLETELGRLGVEVCCNTPVDSRDILAEQADHVIIATGALPREEGVQFASAAPARKPGRMPILSPAGLFAAPRLEPGKNVLIYDEVGHYEGIAAAEHLLEGGMNVTYVCPGKSLAPLVDHDTRTAPALRRFARLGDFRLILNGSLEAVGDTTCTVRTAHQAAPEDIETDRLVMVTAKNPVRDLYEELLAMNAKPAGAIGLVGDARAPRDLQYAIADAHRHVRANL
jgi:2,4-dienoyl-CoA reductase-like NADH-dependent reductase (Old Yellow Enzyme family)/pyruvate/2-oxoglutarate dehydrogenase complex dihydrolipoamide dehydrogenase (E3) component